MDYSDASGALILNFITRLNLGAESQGDIIKDIENAVGSAFNDVISADNVDNTLWGGDGNDYLRGRNGDDVLYGGNGNDQLRGELGADTLDGGAGIDMIFYITTTTAVEIDLSTGFATGGHATGDVLIDIESIRGSFFNDTLTGNSANNRIEASFGHDTVMGLDGNDLLYGDGGNDLVYGGNGVDFVGGGAGYDTLSGGSGGDRFVFNATNWGQDHITDWEDGVGLDRLDFRGSGLVFGDLTITRNSGNARIEYVNAGETNIIILDGIDTNVTTIDANDMIFV
jgi:Ca2+-binding RTX toxin-like protein